MIYIVVMAIYLLLILAVGMYVSRTVKDSDDWAVAGRSLGVLPAAGTYFATVISAVSFMGYMGYYYNNGWGGWWNWAGTAIATLIFAGWFAARLRRFGKVTLADFLEARYGRKHAAIASAMVLFSTVLFTVAQLVGSGVLINTITGIDYKLAVIGVGIIFLLFTIAGGMLAVAWTDTVSAGIILVGVVIMMFTILGKVGGFTEMHRILAETNPAALDPFAGGKIPLGVAISWMVTWGIGNFGVPQLMTRFYSCKDEHVARMSQGWTGLALMFFYGPLMIIGLGASILIPGIEKADAVAPTIILQMINPLLGAVIVSAVLAAAISTADSVLLLAGTTAVRDIYQKYINPNADSRKVLTYSRYATFVIGIVAIILALGNNSTVLMIQANMVGILGSMIAMTVIIGFAWKRSNAQGGMAGMVVGISTAIIWYMLGKPFGWFPILPSIFTSSIANIVVSLVTAPPKKEVVERFFGDQQYFEDSMVHEISA